MKTAFECKVGTVIKIGSDIYMVTKYDYRRAGRGSTTVNLRLKNLINGSTVNKVFDGADKLEDIYLNRQKFEYLYKNGSKYVFMNQESYEQVEIDEEDLGDNIKFLKEGIIVDIQEYDGKFIGVIMPSSVTLKVVETAPGTRSNTVDGKVPMKEAKLETGAIVMVPMFINEGDEILVGTDEGNYLERVS